LVQRVDLSRERRERNANVLGITISPFSSAGVK
jgi:hypothetical protein